LSNQFARSVVAIRRHDDLGLDSSGAKIGNRLIQRLEDGGPLVIRGQY